MNDYNSKDSKKKEKRKYLVVYPGSEKLDLTPERKPVAILLYKSHAEDLVKRWREFGEIEKITKSQLIKLLEEEKF